MDIFDIVFGAFTAFNQLGFLFAGGVCLLIALLILGDAAFWFLKGERVSARITGIRATGIKDPERELDEEQISAAKPVLDQASQSYRQEFKKAPVRTTFGSLFVMLFALIPLIFFGFGAYVAYDYLSLKTTGIAVNATIADIESERSDDGTSYYAVVSYSDHEGVYYRLRDSIGRGGSSAFAVGETVQVFYDAKDPEHFIIDDFWHYMVLAIAFMAIPLVFILIMVLASNSGKRRPKKRGDGQTVIKPNDYKSEMYYPVYEFKMPNGNVAQINDDSGSNMLSASRLGKKVTLYLKGKTAESARRPSKLILFIGLVFLAPGLLFTYLAVTTFEFTVMTPIVLLALMAWGFSKIKKSSIIKPRDIWENRHEFKTRMGKKLTKKIGKGRLLTADEIRNRLIAYDRQIMNSVPVVAIIATLMLAGGVYLWNDMTDKMAASQTTQGTIVRIDSDYDLSADGSGYTYYGVVKYQTESNELFEFRDNVGSSHALFETGDTVAVLYDPTRPHDAIIDRGLWNWSPSMGLMVFGGFLMVWVMRTYLAVRARLSYSK